ncbi:MAG: hypothetical protein KFF49_03555 [Bacteroidales bacterium]|nr:hypothetical protein [Bacteroidales bacterium]
MRVLKTIKLTIVILMLASGAAAQADIEPPDSISLPQEGERLRPASVRELCPVKATMMAAAFPGLGQVYNRKYWKIPLVYAGFGALAYSIILNTNNFDGYMGAYKDITDAVPETVSYQKYTPGFDPGEIDPALGEDNYNPQTHSWVKDQMLNAISYYRRYRDLSYIGVGFWYILSIVDANVDAIMSDYDISPDLSLSIEPVPISTISGPAMGLGVRVTF